MNQRTPTAGWRSAFDAVVRDLRFSIRQITRAPIVTTVAALLLALGIGVNTTLISFIDVALGQYLPGLSDTRGLVRLYPYVTGERGPSILDQTALSWDEFRELREQQRVFLDVAVQGRTSSIAVDANGSTRALSATYVTGKYFSVMRLRMSLGTGFPPTDDANPEPQPIAVISRQFWKSAYGGDSTVIGQTIRVNRMPLTIVGVLPQDFRGTDGNDSPVWVPYSVMQTILPQGATPGLLAYSRIIVARLRPGVSQQQATAAATAMAKGWGTTYREQPLTEVIAFPLGFIGPHDRNDFAKAAAVAGALTIFILLIVCANVSVLLLGRAVARRREIALRLALGAGRGRVVRQLLTENILLAAGASVLSMLLVTYASHFLRANFDMPFSITPSWRTALATFVLAAVTGIIFGLLPALHATRVSINDALKSGGGSGDVSRSAMQRRFVVTAFAMSTALACATGLLLYEVRRINPEATLTFEPSDRVLTLSMALGQLHYSGGRVESVLEQVRGQLQARPGVSAVSFAGQGASNIRIDGASADTPPQRATERDIMPSLYVTSIDSAYFAARGGSLSSGRAFGATDHANSLPVAIIDATLAQKQWPGKSPLGQLLHLVANRGSTMVDGKRVAATPLRYDLTVVGVVDNHTDPSAVPLPGLMNVYVPRAQLPDSSAATLYMRTTGPAMEHVNPVKQIIRMVDADIPISVPTTTQEQSDRRGAEFRQAIFWMTVFGVIALLMACVGVYAVIAFGVAQRTREIGIRIALGAEQHQVVGLFFRGGMRLALLGTLIGVPFGLVALRLFSYFSGEEEFTRIMKAPAIAATTVVLIAVGALASWIPARGAARVDPVDALRSD